VFDIDLQRCPRCGAAQVRIIAAILERAAIDKILTHLGLAPPPPPRSTARKAEHESAAWVAAAHAGTHPVACSGWRAASVALRATARGRPRGAASRSARGGILGPPPRPAPSDA
jgi:hypothetical protein